MGILDSIFGFLGDDIQDLPKEKELQPLTGVITWCNSTPSYTPISGGEESKKRPTPDPFYSTPLKGLTVIMVKSEECPVPAQDGDPFDALSVSYSNDNLIFKRFSYLSSVHWLSTMIT